MYVCLCVCVFIKVILTVEQQWVRERKQGPSRNTRGCWVLFRFIFSDLEVECISTGQLPRSRVIWGVCLLPVVVCEEVTERHRPNLLLWSRGCVVFPFYWKTDNRRNIFIWISCFRGYATLCALSQVTWNLFFQYLYSSNGLTNKALSNFLSWFPEGSSLGCSLSCHRNHLTDLCFPFLPPSLRQWTWESLPWLHTSPHSPFSGFRLSFCSLHPPLVAQTPRFHQISLGNFTFDSGKGNPKRSFTSLVAGDLASQAQGSINHLPWGCWQSSCKNVDDSEQGAQFFFLTLSSGWHDTALEATIPEWLMPHENTL